MKLFSGQKSQEMLDYLSGRRSAMVQTLAEPPPSKDELEAILNIAARVPDHGKLSPWYFIVFQGEQRARVGKKIKEIYLKENPDAKAEHIEIEAGRFLRAPMVIAVVSRMRTGKPPMWEQILSSGAVCMNLSLAANASGFGAQWLTEWYAYHPAFREYLGLDKLDNIAGFIHIGTLKEMPEERPRPQLDHIVTEWSEGAPLNKGDIYNSDKFGWPVQGFGLPDL